MKSPLLSDVELENWVGAGGLIAGADTEETSSERSSRHEFLFRRPGAPSPLGPLILSRSVLLVCCSGVVSILGLVLVLAGPGRRPLIGLAIAVMLMFCGALDLDVTLQLLPCGILGLLLTLVAAAIQWTVTRRRTAAAARASTPLTGTAPPPSSLGALIVDGSDESTAIRPRPPAAEAYLVPRASSAEATSLVPDTGVRP